MSAAKPNCSKEYYYGKQLIDKIDIESVREVLTSDFLSQGPCLQEFEKAVANYCEAKYCLAVSNGTAALHLAAISLGLDEGKTAWTTPLTFVATPNSVRYCRATIDFVDIDDRTWNMSIDLLEEKLKKEKYRSGFPKVLIPVHFAGTPCDMPRVKQLAVEYGIKVIEDACQAMGASYGKTPVGSCEFSDITVFSLHPVKSITSGEGGLILTNDLDLYSKMKSLRVHGIRTAAASQNKDVPPWHAEMTDDGFNYKITEIQCALGLSQLNKLDRFIEKRRILSNRYKEHLTKLPVSFQDINPEIKPACHLMSIRFDMSKINKPKIQIYKEMKANGINMSVHYLPVHQHKIYQSLGFYNGQFPVAEKYYSEAFSLPMHPGLELEDIDFICNQLKSIVSRMA